VLQSNGNFQSKQKNENFWSRLIHVVSLLWCLTTINDCQSSEFPPVEEPTCDPYSPAYTDAVFSALDLDGPEYSTVDADIMKGFKELIC